MILISSCLVGEKVRYDGRDQLDSELKKLVTEGKAVAACPELMGGLNVPREPAEIVGGEGVDVWQGTARVMTLSGKDVTAAFKEGAEKTLKLCHSLSITVVILKENSPSCGSQHIYTGSFNGEKRMGSGVTTALLEMNNIQVLNENDPQLEGHLFD
ncbi:DUF523 domain-containing protein [Macrococcus hajekii]|uniref:DUF523 domain-containing protein n=1 Tax=Macrococcus hajekii TaxID=198482 RepID=A0A4R6BIW2_9STAP|nr:DUF523 domain-containing protein [Macrococcus hajekii]TDM01537.1 DUF523 domain-containing protein [Macrococcus hajekii]GGB00832.1 hypothetical protein GCM10007190_06120 [Macrococcus hajekii]